MTLVDLSPGQLVVARERIREHGVESSVTLAQGTITDLGLSANVFDATCCLGGPLSHVLEESDRERAVRELRRVSTRDAPVFVSVMGLLGAVQLYLLTGHNLEALPELLEGGDYDADLLEPYGYENEFTATHFFRRAELESLLERAGLDPVTTTGLEGLASPLHDSRFETRLDELSDAERAALEETVRLTGGERPVADLSVHMLAVADA